MLESKKDKSGTFSNVWKRITALAILLPSISAILKHKFYVLFSDFISELKAKVSLKTWLGSNQELSINQIDVTSA